MLFMVAFAAMILSAVLWCQQVWGYSALRTGLALAPGPLMVPALAVGAGPLARRIGPGPVAALGNIALGAGVLLWAGEVGLRPHYVTELLPGMLITGVGVGLALPTLMAAAATALPPQRFATGSGVVNMARQIGAVLGVAVLVSILGTPHGPTQALTAFQHAWVATGIIGGIAAVASLALPRQTAPAPTPGSAAATGIPGPGGVPDPAEGLGRA
jgi:MFS family permease